MKEGLRDRRKEVLLYYLLTVGTVVSLLMYSTIYLSSAEQHVAYAQLQCENGGNCTDASPELLLPLPSDREVIDETTKDDNELALQDGGREKDENLGERMNNDENAGKNENPLILPFP